MGEGKLKKFYDNDKGKLSIHDDRSFFFSLSFLSGWSGAFR